MTLQNLWGKRLVRFLLPVSVFVALFLWIPQVWVRLSSSELATTGEPLAQPTAVGFLFPLIFSAVILGFAYWVKVHVERSNRAQEELQNNEQRFRLLYEDAPLSYQILDEDGCLVEVNQAWLNALGYTREEVIGRWYGKFISAEHRPRFKEDFSKYKERGALHDVEFEMMRRDGSTILVGLEGKAGYDEQGYFKQMHMLLRDVTQARSVEKVMQEERRLFTAGPVVVFKWLAKENWPVEYVSPNVWEQFGYQPEAFTRNQIRYTELIDPEDLARVVAEIQDYTFLPLDHYEQEYRFRRADGEWRWVQDSTRIGRDPKGVVTHFQSYILDVTERKEAQNKVHQSKDHFQRIFHASPAAMIITTLQEGRILDVNDACLLLMGYSRGEIVGRKSSELNVLVVPPDNTDWVHFLRQMGCIRRHREILVHTKSGNTLEATASVEIIDFNGLPCLLGMIQERMEQPALPAEKSPSQELFQRAFQANSSGIAVIAVADGRILDVNQAFLEIMEYSRDDVIGKSTLDLNVWKNPQERETLLATVQQQFHLRNLELQARTKSGKTVILEVCAESLELSGQSCVLWMFNEVTERKHTEMLMSIQRDLALQLGSATTLNSALNDLLAALCQIEGIDVGGIYLRNLETSELDLVAHRGLAVEFINQVSHYSSDHPNSLLVLGGRPVYEKVSDLPPDFTELVQRAELRSIAVLPVVHEGQVVAVINLASQQIEELSSSTRQVLESLAVQVGGVIARFQTRNALQQSEDRFSRLAECTHDLIYRYEFKPQPHFAYVNSAVTAIIGYTPEEHYQDPDLGWKIVHPDDQPLLAAMVGGDLTERIRQEIRCIRKDGQIIWTEQENIYFFNDQHEIIALEGIARDITQRKQADEALQRHEQLLQTTLESTADGILVVDEAGQVTHANQRFIQLWKIPPEILQTKDDQKLLDFVLNQLLYPQEFLNKVKELYQSKAESFDLLEFKDGRALERYSCPLIQDDALAGRVWSFRDITTRKLAETALQESESTIQAITRSAQDAILMMDSRGQVSFWNVASERIFGWTQAEALGRNLHELIAPERYHEAYQRAFPPFAVTGHGALLGKTIQLSARKKDQSEITIELSLSAVQLQGEWHAVGVIRDVTARLQADQALRESEARFRTLVENQGEGVCIADLEENFVFANPAAERLFGVPTGELVGKNLRVFLDAEQFAFVRQQTARRQSGERGQYELEIHRLDGEKRFLTIAATPLFDDQNQLQRILGVFRDVTEMKQAEAVLKQSELELSIRNRISDIFLTAPDAEMYDQVLQIILKVVESPYGIFGYINNEGAWVCPTLSREIFEQCQIPDKALVFPRESWGGIWGRTLQEGVTCCENVPMKVPHGHIPMQRALSVPIIHQDKVIGSLVVANKATDYHFADQHLLEVIGRHIAPVLHARLQRDKQGKERQQAEVAQQESERRFRDALENVNLMAVQLDSRGQITFCNDFLLTLMGWAREEVLGQNWFDRFLPGEGREETKAVFADLITGQRLLSHYENAIVTRTGELRLVHWNNTLLFDPQGHILGTSSLGEDITEQRQQEKLRETLLNINQLLLGELDAERALQGLSEQLSEHIPHQLAALTMIQKERDKVELVLSARTGFDGNLGYREVSNEYFESYHGSLTQQILFDRRRRLQPQIPDTGTQFDRLLREWGLKSYLALPLINGGVPLGMFFLISDQPGDFSAEQESILEQIQAQLSLYVQHQRLIERVMDSEAQYRTLFENSNDVIYILQDKRFVYVNKKFEELLEYAPTELNQADFDFMNLVAPESVPLIQERSRRVAAGEKVAPNYEFKGISKSGKIYPFDVSVTYTTCGGKPAVQGILRDVSERQRLQIQQQEMQLELVQSAKLSSIGLLAAGIAHNVNVPLQGIIGHVELLKLSHQDLPYLDDLLTQAQRIGAIINNLLFKSRQEEDQNERDINLNQLLVEELNFLDADLNFKHHIRKDYQFDPQLPPLRGVYSDFSQALLNLIRNALDAMYQAPQKVLTVRTKALTDDEVLVEIRDTGCGISPEHRDRIFEPFFSTKPPTGLQKGAEPTGTGLGLSSSYQLLKKYQARLEVDTMVGVGTSFKIFLPNYKHSPTPEKTTERSDPEMVIDNMP